MFSTAIETTLGMLEGEAATGMCAALLAPLKRRSQRSYALRYVYGLLTATGRKTISKIASTVGGAPGSAQALHHFISESPWDWQHVRRSMAQYVEAAVQPRAWVVAPLLIPKSGPHSVGVGSIFVPDLGGRAAGQRAYGVWLADEGASYPVNWRIHLPKAWLEETRRQQVGIPTQVGPPTLENCVVQAVLDTAAWGLVQRPVVVDTREADTREIVEALTEAGIPFLLKVSCSTRVLPRREDPNEAVGAPLSVLHLSAALRQKRHHVTWRNPRARAVASSLAATTPVRLPGGTGADLVVLYEWQSTRGRPSTFWISSMTDQSSEELVRFARLALQVNYDTQETGTDVGLRDFEGRTYRGWHHHMTLASAAHSAVMLASSTSTPTPTPAAAGQERMKVS